VSKREPPNVAQPVVQKVRIRYIKSGPMRFASHRDFQRALERAVSRSGLPIAFSGGFNPHPRISYANAAPTGTASNAEYVELGLKEAVDVAAVASVLTPTLPHGFSIAESHLAQPGPLAERLRVSEWLIELTGTTAAELDASLTILATQPGITVDRMTKNGLRPISVGESWVSATTHASLAGADLRVISRHMIPTVRPEDIVNGLVAHAQLPKPAAARYTRLAQGSLLADGSVGDPLAPVQT